MLTLTFNVHIIILKSMLGVIRHQSSKKYMIRRCYITIQKICYTHTHTRLTAFFCDYSGEPVPERENQSGFYWSKKTVSGSGISWDVCKSACRSRQITTPAPHHSVFYRPDALPGARPTASKHWRLYISSTKSSKRARMSDNTTTTTTTTTTQI